MTPEQEALEVASARETARETLYDGLYLRAVTLAGPFERLPPEDLEEKLAHARKMARVYVQEVLFLQTNGLKVFRGLRRGLVP
jgi:hypothetical protein